MGSRCRCREVRTEYDIPTEERHSETPLGPFQFESKSSAIRLEALLACHVSAQAHPTPFDFGCVGDFIGGIQHIQILPPLWVSFPSAVEFITSEAAHCIFDYDLQLLRMRCVIIEFPPAIRGYSPTKNSIKLLSQRLGQHVIDCAQHLKFRFGRQAILTGRSHFNPYP